MRCPACSGGTPVGGPDVTPHPSTTVPAPSNLDHEGRICITSLRRASHRALSAEGLGVERVDALPPETIAQVIREGLLHQPIFTVDVDDHRRLFQRASNRADRVDRAVEIEIAGTLLHAAPAANGRRVNLAIVPSAPPRRLPASSRGLRACAAPARGLLVLSGSASQRAPRDRYRRNLEWRRRGGIALRSFSAIVSVYDRQRTGNVSRRTSPRTQCRMEVCTGKCSGGDSVGSRMPISTSMVSVAWVRG